MIHNKKLVIKADDLIKMATEDIRLMGIAYSMNVLLDPIVKLKSERLLHRRFAIAQDEGLGCIITIVIKIPNNSTDQTLSILRLVI